jgi:hypothetical protein
LRHEREVKEGYDRFRRESPRRLTPEELDHIRSLATDIPALWHAPDTPAADRKEIVRALIARVTLALRGHTEHADVRIDWIGGSVSQHALCRPIARYDRLADYPRLREQVETCVTEGQTAAQIADQLNKEGFHPPSGRADRFAQHVVGNMIYCFGLSRPRPPAIALSDNEWWARDIASEIGVTLTRFRHWIKQGFVHVRRVGPRRHLVIWADADERERLHRLRDHRRCDRLHPYPNDLTRPKLRKGRTRQKHDGGPNSRNNDP